MYPSNRGIEEKDVIKNIVQPKDTVWKPSPTYAAQSSGIMSIQLNPV